MHNTGSIVAVEANPRRMRSLSFNLARCRVMNSSIYQMDAINCSNLSIRFDRILLDAPCSGEGMIWNDILRRPGRNPGWYCRVFTSSKKIIWNSITSFGAWWNNPVFYMLLCSWGKRARSGLNAWQVQFGSRTVTIRYQWFDAIRWNGVPWQVKMVSSVLSSYS
jgi:hypothetical protein